MLVVASFRHLFAATGRANLVHVLGAERDQLYLVQRFLVIVPLVIAHPERVSKPPVAAFDVTLHAFVFLALRSLPCGVLGQLDTVV